MADFKLETPVFFKPEVSIEIPEIEFDPEKFKQEIEVEKQKWKTGVQKLDDSYFEQFLALKEFEDKSKPFLRGVFTWRHPVTGFPEYRTTAPLHDKEFNEDMALIRKWERFKDKKHRERFNKLTAAFQTIEIAKGGISGENLAWRSFEDGLADGLTFGILDQKHPIYGVKHREVHGSSNGWGNMIGSLVNFMLLSQLASVMKIPELFAKTKSFKPILKILGAPKYWAGKIGKYRFATTEMVKMIKGGAMKLPVKYLKDQAVKYGTVEAAGAMGLTTGLVGAFGESVRHTARRFKHEDNMSEKEWKKSLPRAMLEGFLQKYFIGVINDPTAWSARFLGDAVYSLGQQSYRIATGEQEEWNSESFWRDFIQGHLMGEVQGIIFRPNRKQLAQMHSNNKLMEYADGIRNRLGGNPEEHFVAANALWQGELRHAQEKQRFYTSAERQDVIKKFNGFISKKGGYKLYKGITGAKVHVIKSEEFDKIRDKMEDKLSNKAYDIAKERLGLNDAEIKILQQRNALEDKSVFIKTLKELGRLEEKPIEIKPQTAHEAMRNINPMTVDELMDNLDTAFRSEFKKDVDVSDVFTAKGGKVPLTKAEVKGAAVDVTSSKEEAVEQLLQWLYDKGNYIKLVNNFEKKGIPEPKDTVSDAMEQFLKVSGARFDELRKGPIEYFMGILKNEERASIRKKTGAPERKDFESIEDLAAPESIGINQDRYSAPIYRVYSQYAAKNGRNLKRFMAFYLKSLGNTREEVLEKMSSLGISVSGEHQVSRWSLQAAKEIENMILSREVQQRVSRKRRYTDKEAAAILTEVIQEGESLNPVTGARVQVPRSIEKRIKKDGGYVISFNSLYNEVRDKYGASTARKVLWKAHDVMAKEIANINSYLNKKEGSIEIRNPLDNNSTDFVIYQRGLDADDFRDAVQQLNTVLVKNYDDVGGEGERFAVTIQNVDGETGDVISSFDNISINYVRDLAKGINSQYESVKDLARFINPVAHTIIQKSINDTTNEKMAAGIFKLDKLIRLTPRTDEQWGRILGKMAEKNPVKVEKIAKALQEISVEAPILLPKLIPQQQVASRIKTDLLTKTSKDEQDVEAESISVNDKDIINEMIKQDIKDLFFLDIGAGFEKGKAALDDYRSSLKKFIVEKFTTFENLAEKGEAQQRAIIILNKLANTANKADYKSSDIIKMVFEEFHADVVAGGGDAGRKAMMAFGRIGQFQREEEFKTIFKTDKETGNIVRQGIRPNELYNEISWVKGSEGTQRLVENLKGRPQDIDQRDILQIKKASNDPLVLSKILVQNYNIKPEQVIALMKRLHERWYQPLASWTVRTGDKNFDYFENIKSNLEKTIRRAIRFNVKDLIVEEGKSYSMDKINFDIDGKEAVERFVNHIPDVERRDRVLKALDFYYGMDPDRLSYVHHQVLGTADNQKIFMGQIKNFINGKAVRGEKAADPFMEELLTERKFPTLLKLVEEGYRVDDNYLNVLQGTMRYAYSKRINEEIANQWKTSYMKGFIKAMESGDKNLLSWVEEHSGYFYLPGKSEFKANENRLKEINEVMKIMADKNSPRYIGLGKEAFEINERLGVMKIIRDKFTGKLRDQIAEKILGSESFIPANFDSYKADFGSKGTDAIMAGVKDQVDDMRSANLSNYEGLYFNRVLWKGMRNLVFRNDGLNKEYKYSFHEKNVKMYDKVNRFLKLIRFYKPTIIMMNDMVQSGMASASSVRNLPWAFGTYFNRNEKVEGPDGKMILSERAKFYQDMEEMNLFNKAVSMEPMMSEGAKGVAAVMGKPGVLGKVRDDIGLRKTIYGKVAEGVKGAWRMQQGVTWGLDEVIRLSTAKTMYDKFKNVYDPERAKFMAAEWTNQFLVKYSRIPSSTRRILNRVGFVLTYRLQTLRMYKEMMKSFGRGAKRLVTGGKDPEMFKVSDDPVKQAMFEMAPLLRTLVMKGSVKGMLAYLLGFGFNNFFDAVTGYRMKRRKPGEGILDTELEFLSLGTPLFDIEKHITRLSRAPYVWMKYNLAAFPGLILSLVQNEDIVTGEKMVKADWAREPRKATAQLGMRMFTTYFPWAGEINRMSADNVGLAEGLISNFGLGYYYKYKNPAALLEEFRDAVDKTKSLSEHKRALKDFQFSMKRAYKSLFQEEFKDIADRLEEAKKASGG